MRFNKNSIISPEQLPKQTTVYLGFVLLRELSRHEKLSIFQMYSIIRKKAKIFNYGAVISALVFLYSLGLIDFNAPYIYRLK